MPATIEQMMTVAPQTIGAEMTLETARRMMLDFNIRHLPVRSAGRLVGVVSDRDLAHTPLHHPVSEVMERDPLVVGPESLVRDVAISMADRHADAAIVVSGDRVVGIFTATDVERALAATLDALDERR